MTFDWSAFTGKKNIVARFSFLAPNRNYESNLSFWPSNGKRHRWFATQLSLHEVHPSATSPTLQYDSAPPVTKWWCGGAVFLVMEPATSCYWFGLTPFLSSKRDCCCLSVVCSVLNLSFLCLAPPCFTPRHRWSLCWQESQLKRLSDMTHKGI